MPRPIDFFFNPEDSDEDIEKKLTMKRKRKGYFDEESSIDSKDGAIINIDNIDKYEITDNNCNSKSNSINNSNSNNNNNNDNNNDNNNFSNSSIDSKDGAIINIDNIDKYEITDNNCNSKSNSINNSNNNNNNNNNNNDNNNDNNNFSNSFIPQNMQSIAIVENKSWKAKLSESLPITIINNPSNTSSSGSSSKNLSNDDRISEYPNKFDNHYLSCTNFPSECTCDLISFIYSSYHMNPVKDRCGKWMLFLKKDNVDSAWCKVKTLLHNGLLGISAKVSNNRKGSQKSPFLICIYTKDYKDIPDVTRVLMMLRDSGIYNGIEKCRLNYKTDNSTYSGNYSSESGAINVGLSGAKKPSGPICIFHSPKEKPNHLLLFDKSLLAERKFDVDKSEIIDYSYKQHEHKIISDVMY